MVCRAAPLIGRALRPVRPRFFCLRPVDHDLLRPKYIRAEPAPTPLQKITMSARNQFHPAHLRSGSKKSLTHQGDSDNYPPLQCRCRWRARASLRNRHQGPSIMGFEDEAEQSFGRPCRQTNGRSKRTYDLTSSIVPPGTSFHRSVELRFPPIAFDPARLSCRCDFPGPAELGAVNPYAVHDHGEPTGQGHDCLFHSAAPGDLHCPGFEPGPFRRTHQHDLGRFIEHRPHHLVAASRYATATSVDLARLILGWRQSQHRPDRLGVPEAGGHVDGRAIGQRHHRADTGDRHQAPAHIIVPDNGQQAAMQDADLLAKHPPDNEQRFDQTRPSQGDPRQAL